MKMARSYVMTGLLADPEWRGNDCEGARLVEALCARSGNNVGDDDERRAVGRHTDSLLHEQRLPSRRDVSYLSSHFSPRALRSL